jgi:hypothetical protein
VIDEAALRLYPRCAFPLTQVRQDNAYAHTLRPRPSILRPAACFGNDDLPTREPTRLGRDTAAVTQLRRGGKSQILRPDFNRQPSCLIVLRTEV